MYEYKKVKNKDLYIVESHHHMLMPWSLIRRETREAPNLITLDHHTDTIEPFHLHLCKKCKSDELCYQSNLTKFLSQVNYQNDRSIENAITLLEFDEHIQTATSTGILNIAFAINLSNNTTQSIDMGEYFSQLKSLNPLEKQTIPRPTEPYSYALPLNRIFEIDVGCREEYEKIESNQDYEEWKCHQVLETFYLEKHLAVANTMSSSAGVDMIENSKYILDIDLDYFHSEESTAPKDSSTIYRLIRNAEAITIALEPGCVEDLKLDGSSITSQSLFDSICELISNAQE